MVKVIVTGAGGKMGSRIIGMISAMEELRVVGAIEVKGHPIIGRDLGHSLGAGRTGALVSDSLADCIDQADVVIDFTDHEASLTYLKIASEKNRAIVIGSRAGFMAVPQPCHWRAASVTGGSESTAPGVRSTPADRRAHCRPRR